MTGRTIRILELRSVRGTGGGPEKTIFVGASIANHPRIHVTVCYIRDERDNVFSLQARAKALGVDYVEVPERHSIDPGVLPRLEALVRNLQIDLVHAHEYKTDVLTWLLARRTGVVPLATAHGWTGHSFRERRIYYRLDKWILSRYPRVVAVSTDIKEELVRYGADPNRVTVILNAIDPNTFRRDITRGPLVRSDLELPHDAIVVGAVGRAEPQKRFDLLLDAMAPIIQRDPKVHVVIAGDGSQLAALQRRAAELDITSRCLFTGHRQDVADLHQAFDVFVQSSDYEGTPNAVLEAMAMETPLVATDAGGTRELMFDGIHGLLIPLRDTVGLQRAIEQVLSDPDSAAARAKAARRRVETELSFEARTRRLEAIYEELVHA